MNNLAFFPGQEHDHSADSPEAKSPDAAELQRLLGSLMEAVNPRPAIRSEREIRIRNFRSDRWRLAEDLIVVLEDRGDQYIANSYDTGQYGIGGSPDGAIEDLCSVLEDYYDLLSEDREQLGDSLRGHLRYLDSILQELG